MKCSAHHLYTPVYLKLTETMPWPEEEEAFYLLSRDGLFLCRNTRFYRSCVPARNCPAELAAQKAFLKLSYPRIPRRLMEQVIGFFDIIGERHASEAAVLLAWNQITHNVELVVPDQVGLVGTTWGGHPFPVEVQYDIPELPEHLVLLGDVHSHVDGPAYASSMDKSDESHWPGLHLVIGRIQEEPPQIHCDAVTDGARFRVSDLGLVLEGYHKRRVDEVPQDWIDRVTIKPWSSKFTSGNSTSYGTGSTSDYVSSSGHQPPAWSHPDHDLNAMGPTEDDSDPSDEPDNSTPNDPPQNP